MSDLISRQALQDATYHEAFETDSDMQKWDSGCWIRYKMFENVVEALPSAQPDVPDTNVGDTISRQAAIDFIDAGRFVNPNEPRWSDNEIVNFLKSRPSAQPEIIRCKDCKYKNRYKFPPKYDERDYCERNERVTQRDGFCYWAERRTDE